MGEVTLFKYFTVGQTPIYNLCLMMSHGQGQNLMCGNETELVDAL